MYLLLQADQRRKQNHEDLLTSAYSSTGTEPICERFWTKIEPGTCSKNALPVSKRLTTLLRHGHLPREEDGAIEFWRLKDWLRNEFENSQHWSDEMWKSKMAGGGGNKKRVQYCTESIRTKNSLSSSSSRSFRTQSHWSFITGQCVNSEQVLRVHLSYWMCSQLTLHHKFRIDTRRSKFEQQTDSILYSRESHGQGTQRSVWDWLERTTSCMVQAGNVKETLKHCVLGWNTACSTERIEVLSNKIKCNHPLRHTSSLLYPESCCDGIWRNHIRESIYVTSASSKDSFKDNCMKELGSEVAGSSKDTQHTQPKTKNPIIKHGETCGRTR